MRLLSALLVTLALASAALAQTRGEPGLRRGEEPRATGRAEPAQPPVTLPGLYERLKGASSAEEAQSLVRQIARRWSRSGSDTSDLLMQRAKESLARQQAPLTVELLDRVIALQPEWAEAWHVRGMAFFVMQDDFRAVADFRETLRREPGHFMALGMTAAALQRQGDEAGALKAFRAVQAMNPFFDGVKAAIERLVPNVDGRDA